MSDEFEPIDALTFSVKCKCGGRVRLLNSWKPTDFESFTLVQCLVCKTGWRVGPSMIQVSLDARQSDQQAMLRYEKKKMAQ